MTEFSWCLFPEGDARRREAKDATATPAHWIDVARAAEYAGFHALQVPSGPQRPDAWLLAATLSRATRQLRMVVAFRPGFMLPAVAAQSAQTLYDLTHQRLALGLLVGGDSAEHRAYGDAVNHDDRFERAAEFIRVVKQSWKGRGSALGFNHRGPHYRVENAGLIRALRHPPPLHIGGSGPSTERIAAEHADAYVLWGEPPAALAERIRRVRALAAAQGRTLRVACRLHLIARETDIEAWQAADAALQSAWPTTGTPPAARSFFDTASGLWRGVGPLRGRVTRGQPRWEDGAGLVGDYRTVADLLQELQAVGVDDFVLSGEQGLEDALRLGEEVLPLVRPVPTPVATPVATPRAPLTTNAV
ncbi:LLM class flavin-dependent oxidoreductase [Variovorax boronicumulans]|uniref:LLM class flavin-dependent oxidoreductase n=1 Tax=Variovorax boronicumulans TaxID=436515 RepID=UPI001C56ABB3